MKIYKRKIIASSVFGATEEITHDFDHVLENNKNLILKMINERLEYLYTGKFLDMYAPYVKSDNLKFQASHVRYDWVDGSAIYEFHFKIFLKVPFENTMLWTLADNRNNYSSYADYVRLYLEEVGLESAAVYQQIFWGIIRQNKTTTEEKLESELLQLLKDQSNYIIEEYRYYDSNLNTEYVPLTKFLEWVKPKVKKPRTSVYNKMIAQLQSESEDGINSIYEQTESGEYIDSIAQSVEDSLGIWSEPSIQGGHGSIIFRDKDTDEVLLEKDYEEYCDDVIDMALESKSKKGFMSQLKQYYDI